MGGPAGAPDRAGCLLCLRGHCVGLAWDHRVPPLLRLAPCTPSPLLTCHALPLLPAADVPSVVKNIIKLPKYERLVAELVQCFFMPVKRSGALDMEPELEKSYMY